MSNIEDYNMKIEVIKAIPDDQIKTPQQVPVGIYIMEAQCLYSWCQDDKKELKAKRLDWTVVQDLPVRCGALSQAESNWQLEQKLRRRAEKFWVRESPKGYALRDELIHHNQAFTHLKEAVDYIREYGRYVFWRNPARLKGYRSDYIRKLNKRSTRRNRVPEPEPGDVPVTIDV